MKQDVIKNVIGRGSFFTELSAFFHLNYSYVIAIQNPYIRRRIVENEIDKEKIQLYKALVHSSCLMYSNEIEYGSIICPMSLISCNVKIGQFVVIDRMCNIGHDCIIHDFVTLAPSVTLSGHCEIDSNVYIGSGVLLKENVHICSDVTVGIGATVIKDITESGTYAGVPAIKIKDISKKGQII